MSDREFSKAVRWSFVMNGGIQVGNVLTTFVLASILGAEIFGLVALASFLVLMQEVLVDPGLSSALVQRKDLRDDHLDSVFWLIMANSLVLVGFSWLAAGWWSDFNDEPALVDLVRVLSVAIPIRGLSLVQQAVLMRAMDFRSLAIRTNVGIVAGMIVGISMAFNGYGAWSIVGQQLAFATVSLVLIWKLSTWRPNFVFRLSALRELFGFSFGVYLQRIGNFCYNHAETAVMGYWFSTRAVGLYRFSFRLVNVGVNSGTRAVNMASLPAFARRQDDPEGLRNATLQSIHSATVVTFALLALLAANIEFLLPLLRSNWTEAGVPLQILCVGAAAQVIAMIASTVLQAIGRPYSVAGLSWFWGGITIAAAVAIGWWMQDASAFEQITALACSRAVFAILLHIPVYAAILRSVCRVGPTDLIGKILPSALAAAACIGAARGFVATGLPETLPSLATFVVATSIDGSVFVAFLAAFDRRFRGFIGRMAMRLLQRKS